MHKGISLLTTTSPIVFVCFLLSCNEIKNEEANERFSLPDSLKAKKIIAAFNEEAFFSLLLYLDKDKKQACKYVYYKNKLVLADSLNSLGRDTLYSERHRIRYVIMAHAVKLMREQKTVHPSSNWQGQTPGQYYSSTSYLRIQ